MANGNPFLASLEKYIEQEAKQEKVQEQHFDQLYNSQDVEQEAEVSIALTKIVQV